MVFEPLYYALQAYTRNFLGRLSCFLYFGAAFKKTIFPLAFVGYYYSYLGDTSLLGACETDNY